MGPSYAVSCMMERISLAGRPRFLETAFSGAFPIVGSVWENEYRHEGVSYALTQHGFARDMDLN